MSEKFICNICGKELKTQGALLYHQNKKNSCKNTYSCKLCNKEFKVQFHLKAHLLECKKTDEPSITEKDDLDDLDYKKLLEYIPDMVVKYDRAANFEYVSSSSYKLLGYRPEELIGKNAYDYIFPEDIEYIGELHQKTMAEKKENATFIFRRICKDGSIKKIISECNTVFDSEGNVSNAISCERAL